MNSSFDIIFVCKAKFLRSMGKIFLMRKTMYINLHAAPTILIQEVGRPKTRCPNYHKWSKKNFKNVGHHLWMFPKFLDLTAKKRSLS